MIAESHPDRSVTFRVAGHQYRLSGREVLDRAREALAGDIPTEALRYRNWVVDVDGQPVGVKWLFSLATGLSTDQFNTTQARGVFRRLGLEARSLKQGASLVSPDVPAKAPPSDELAQREFLEQVAQAMRAHLPSYLTPSAVRNRGNCLQIAYPEFRIFHLTLRGLPAQVPP